MKKVAKIYILFFSLALFFLTVPAVFAAPSISGVSGTTSQGNTITISGANFGTKSPAKPMYWMPVEGSSIVADGALSASPSAMGLNSADNWEINSADLPHSRSAKSMRCIPYVSNTKHSCTVKTTDSDGATNIFIFNRRKYAGNWFPPEGKGGMNYKIFRFWPATDKTPDFIISYNNFQILPTGSLNFTNEGTTSLTRVGQVSGPNNQWFTEEVQAGQSDIDVANGSVRYWVNGTKYSRTTLPLRTTALPDIWYRWYIQNHWTALRIQPPDFPMDQPPPAGEYVYFDDIYIDNTWSRVMIGNASTFDASTHREPLIPTSWSASSITAYFNQGAFANGSQAYIFVVDASGNASPGRAITINGTPPPTCTSFTYSAWGTCQSSGTQTRTITSSSPSGCTGGSPITTQTCGFSPATCTSFNYSAWGACQTDNTQTRTVSSSSPSGCTGGDPVLSQSCTYVPPDQSQTLLLGNNTQETGIINANTNQTYLRLMAASLSGQAQKAHISYNNTNSAGCKVLVYDNDKNLLEAVLVPRSGTGWSSASMAGTTNIASGAQYYIGVVCPGYQEIDSSASALLKTVPASSGSSYATPLNPLTGEYNLTGGNLSVYLTGSTSAPAQSCGDQTCNNGETCSTCPGDCGACAKTYTLTDFTNLVKDWLKSLTGSPADVNLDSKVNSRDLGIMMSNWAL